MASRRRMVLGVALGGALGAIVASALGAGPFGARQALAEPPKAGFSPDPPPRAARTNWIFEVSSHDGKVNVDRVRAVLYEKPAETPRIIGRFAIELYIGRELLDRVRFNVPLMGAEPIVNNRNNLPKPRLDQNVSARIEARMADNPRASYVLVVDRESGDARKFLWPPDADGHLTPWTSGLSDAGPGDFPDASVRAAGLRDGGGDGG